MLVSIIIPNLHSALIGRTLESIRQQTYDLSSVQVIVVGMDSHQLVKEDSLVRHLRTKTPVSPAVARNMGMRTAAGDVLAFIDADCVADPDWLHLLMTRLSSPSVDVVGGGIAFPRENYWAVADNLSWFHEVLASAPGGTRAFLPTLNLSLRREVFENVGGLDESYARPAGEDTEWTTRMRLAGYTLHFEPEAVVCHLHDRQTLNRLLKHAYRYGKNSIKVDPQYADVLRTPRVVRHPLSLLVLSPLLAAGATGRIFAKVRRYWRAAPAVYLTKLSWCLGAAQRLSRSRE